MQCQVPVSTRKAASEAYVLLNLVLKTIKSRWHLWSPAQISDLNHLCLVTKTIKRLQRDVRWLLRCSQTESFEFGQPSYELDCFQFQRRLLLVTWKVEYHWEDIIWRLQHINKEAAEMLILLEWSFITQGRQQLLSLLESFAKMVSFLLSC